jgi:hypothetical protein
MSEAQNPSNERNSMPRYIVRDALHGQDLNLIPSGDRRRRNRWQIIDTATNQIEDEFNSKKAATGTARDWSAGTWGPLA